MKKLILYKVRFYINNGVAADLVAAVDESISDKDAKRMLVKELYGNYTTDNDFAFKEDELNEVVKSSAATKIGKLEATDDLIASTEDFSFILLHRTENWSVKK